MQDELTSAKVTSDEAHEAALVELAKAGSAEAWTEIYNAHYPTLFRYIKARTFNDRTAEDLTSAVFLGALKGIGSYRYQGRPLLAWLYRIARNVVASHQRELFASRRLGLRLPWFGQGRESDRAEREDIESVASASDDPAELIDSAPEKNLHAHPLPAM